MKKLTLSLMTVALGLISSSTMAADLITITGEPVVVTKEANADYYVFPSTTTVTKSSDYYYVTMDGTKRVCYTTQPKSLVSLTAMDVKFRIGSDDVSVHCYDASPEYFKVVTTTTSY